MPTNFDGRFPRQDIGAISGTGGKIVAPFYKSIPSCGVVSRNVVGSAVFYDLASCSKPPDILYSYSFGTTVHPVPESHWAEYGSTLCGASWSHSPLTYFRDQVIESVGQPFLKGDDASLARSFAMNLSQHPYMATTNGAEVRAGVFRLTSLDGGSGQDLSPPASHDIVSQYYDFTLAFSPLKGKCGDVIGGTVALSYTFNVTLCGLSTGYKPKGYLLSSTRLKMSVADKFNEDDRQYSDWFGNETFPLGGGYSFWPLYTDLIGPEAIVTAPFSMRDP